MSVASLFRRNHLYDASLLLYGTLVEQARRPAFFAALGVPDTLDGRFELIALHEFLVLNRLKAERVRTEKLAQALFDIMFSDMDRALREMGVGDLGVGKHVKRMAKAFYGRVVSYERGLAAGGAELREALQRNLYGTAAAQELELGVLADYVARAAAGLAAQSIDDMLAGRVSFPPPEA
jgi:cytochrome b pre-mRNA-processing protein 3